MVDTNPQTPRPTAPDPAPWDVPDLPPAPPRHFCTDCGLSRTDNPKRCGQACQFIQPDYPALERRVHAQRLAREQQGAGIGGRGALRGGGVEVEAVQRDAIQREAEQVDAEIARERESQRPWPL